MPVLWKILSAWFTLHLLFIGVALCTRALKYLSYQKVWNASFASLLNLSRWALLGSVALSCIHFLPKEGSIRPREQTFSSITVSAPQRFWKTSVAPQAARISESLRPLSSSRALWIPVLLMALSLLYQLGKLARDWRILLNFLAQLTPWKQNGRVQVFISAENISPFSGKFPKKSFLVLPSELFRERNQWKMAFRHEAGHLRAHDAYWNLLQDFVKSLLVYNPLWKGFEWDLYEVQELACDESVLNSPGAPSPLAYGRCLIEIATSLNLHRTPVGTTAMADGGARAQLRRRIEMITMYAKSKRSVRALLVGVTGTACLLGGVAFATKVVLQDKTITYAEAEKLAEQSNEGAEFRVTMNDLVYAKLQKFIGTAENRKRLRQGLRRMPQYEEMIQKKLWEYNLPKEFLAIPLYESHYNNDAISGAKARGIWQFMAQTARRYGLVVNDKVDERLDPEKETDAAMRYLTDLNNIFNDLHLAMKGYNEGEHRLIQTIRAAKTRDPWELERFSTAEGYLGGAVAMMIVLKNPHILED
jgi:beta-lactamase regulating signal transducer with metallopeptidase domain